MAGTKLSLMRFESILVGVSLATLMLAPASVAQRPQKHDEPQESQRPEDQTFAALVQRLSAELQSQGVKRVLILDLEDPDKKVTPFGSWLADQFATAGSWASIEVVDRKLFRSYLNRLRRSDKGELDTQAAEDLAKTFEAKLVTGSYGAAENGIGVTLRSGTTEMFVRKSPDNRSVDGKIAVTEEMKEQLGKPLEMLVPSNGIYEVSQGGVLSPSCIYCPNPQYPGSVARRGIQGTVLLSAVITTAGRSSDVSIEKELDPSLDQEALNIVRLWKFKPAVNIDGRPVPVHTPIEVVFSLN
jgi:TonB family protein